MNKQVLFGSAILAILAAAPAMANPITIADTTLDVAYNGTSPYGYFPGNASVGDAIGAGFDTQQVVVNVTTNTLELKYYTQFDGSSSIGNNNFKYADIFLAPATNSTSAPAAWSYGIALGDQAEPSGFYSVTGDKTSEDFYSSQSNLIYGGQYLTPDGTGHLVPVDITNGTAKAGWTVSTSFSTNNGGNYPDIVDVVLTAAPGTTLADLFGSSIDILWGTADCANDAIFDTISTVSKVPEPMSLSLFGAGLVGGVVAYRRRKKARVSV